MDVLMTCVLMKVETQVEPVEVTVAEGRRWWWRAGGGDAGELRIRGNARLQASVM